MSVFTSFFGLFVDLCFCGCCHPCFLITFNQLLCPSNLQEQLDGRESTLNLFLKIKEVGVALSQKNYTQRPFTEKKNHIGSAVFEISCYTHTHTQTSCYFDKQITICILTSATVFFYTLKDFSDISNVFSYFQVVLKLCKMLSWVF